MCLHAKTEAGVRSRRFADCVCRRHFAALLVSLFQGRVAWVCTVCQRSGRTCGPPLLPCAHACVARACLRCKYPPPNPLLSLQGKGRGEAPTCGYDNASFWTRCSETSMSSARLEMDSGGTGSAAAAPVGELRGRMLCEAGGGESVAACIALSATAARPFVHRSSVPYLTCAEQHLDSATACTSCPDARQPCQRRTRC